MFSQNGNTKALRAPWLSVQMQMNECLLGYGLFDARGIEKKTNTVHNTYDELKLKMVFKFNVFLDVDMAHFFFIYKSSISTNGFYQCSYTVTHFDM